MACNSKRLEMAGDKVSRTGGVKVSNVTFGRQSALSLLTRHGGLALTLLRPPHDKRKRAQASDDQRHDKKAVLETESVGLALHGVVGHRHRLLGRGGGIVTSRDEHRREALQILAEIRIAHAGVGGEGLLVRLVLAREKDTEP